MEFLNSADLGSSYEYLYFYFHHDVFAIEDVYTSTESFRLTWTFSMD